VSDFDANLDEFINEIDDFVASIPDKVTTLQKKIVLEALRRVVLKTPVDTGRARANWQVTIAKPATSVIDNFSELSDGAVIEKGLVAIAELPPYQIVFVSNNVNYIEFLEEGSSKQAPEGMAALTIEELRQMFK